MKKFLQFTLTKENRDKQLQTIFDALQQSQLPCHLIISKSDFSEQDTTNMIKSLLISLFSLQQLTLSINNDKYTTLRTENLYEAPNVQQARNEFKQLDLSKKMRLPPIMTFRKIIFRSNLRDGKNSLVIPPELIAIIVNYIDNFYMAQLLLSRISSTLPSITSPFKLR